MAKKLFSYTLTDEDEPGYFGNLMNEHDIEYYIVPGSIFGFSKPGFWIKNDDDFARAKQLFLEHEEIYARLAREKYQRETGYNPEASGKEKIAFWIHYIKQKPASIFLAVLGFILIAWYFSLFFELFISPTSKG